MSCPFCRLLYKEYIGEYVRIGVVCGCDTNDHIYWDGWIQKSSFLDNTIRLYDCPKGGKVTFVACCDDIFELYVDFAGAAGIKDIPTMVEERRNLSESIEAYLNKEATRDE